jgi:hypothetical protein
MKDWERLSESRKDMSQYVMHCTRPRLKPERAGFVAPYDVLKEILADGFLRAGFAVHQSPWAYRPKPLVRGPYPAVCFTEQPLQFFIQSVEATSRVRYTRFAVAVRKDDLFHYGGRPVIYDREGILGRRTNDPASPPEAWAYKAGLPRDQQYRWVGYDPTVLWDRGDPLDWTHEREWRARPNAVLNGQIGLLAVGDVAVPLLIPTGRTLEGSDLRLIILVETLQQESDLRQWIEGNRSTIAARGSYWRLYSEALAQVPILSFEFIKSVLDASNNDLGRLEDFYPLSHVPATR